MSRFLGVCLFAMGLLPTFLGASPSTPLLRRQQAERLENRTSVRSCGGKGEHRRQAEAFLPYLERALQLRIQDEGSWSLPVARVLISLSENAGDRGDCRQSQDYLARGYEIFKAIKGSEDPETVTLQARLAETFRTQNQAGRAAYRLRKAWHQTQLATGPYAEGPLPEYQAIRANRIGTEYYRQGRYQEAAPLFQRALKLWLPHLGPDHPSILRVRWRLAKIAQKLSTVPEDSNWPGDYVRGCNGFGRNVAGASDCSSP